jgi:hypothetical protein
MKSKLAMFSLTLLMFAPVFSCAQESEPDGKLIFSVELITLANIVRPDGTPVTFKKTGIFYYVTDAASSIYGTTITGYRFANGEIRDFAGEGSIASEDFLHHLQDLPIKNFDVAAAIIETTTALQRQAQQEGGFYSGPDVRDGGEYNISYDFNGVSIHYTAWNPLHTIDALAPHNTDIANFKALIDLFALQYGRRQFGL